MFNKQWLSRHLRTFVKPRLKRVPEVDPDDVAWDLTDTKRLIAAWELAKGRSEGKTILLPGRDVYLFHVLAKLEKFPAIFRPELSSDVTHMFKCGFVELPDYSEHYVLDTGFSGTVPKALGATHWNLVSGAHPLKLRGGTALADQMEAQPTYWRRGLVHGRKVRQSFSSRGEFQRAAQLTQLVVEQAMKVW